ncbi:MAG: M20/M25/M40 family metallo-hydrolase [Phycisphaerae bacterium]
MAPMTMSRKILIDLLSIPTAPFAEHQVLAYLDRFLGRRKLTDVTRDSAGNLLVRVRRGTRRVKRPVCITAHLDHPGFVVDRTVGKSSVRAFWRGGVPEEYFVGSQVRFDLAGRWIKGRIRSVTTVLRHGIRRVDTARVDVDHALPPGTIGMWDFPEPRIRGSRIYARACDDLAGAAAMVACIDRLARSRFACDAYFLFTRAEEVGFIGAIAAARKKTIPAKCIVVAMETSSELVDAKMGDGPILRVGDRASAFTPAVTGYVHGIARELARADKQFRYQRKLMDGGTCESSAYCSLGYDATGLCIALGNYHNVNRKLKKLGPEYVNLNDFDNVVKWFVELARAPHAYTGRNTVLDDQIRELETTYRGLLRRSRRRPC